MGNNCKEPTDLQKRILSRMKDEFRNDDITKQEKNVIDSSFRLRGWVFVEPEVSSLTGKVIKNLYRLTALGKSMRKKYKAYFKNL